jgi:hypothetical protein
MLLQLLFWKMEHMFKGKSPTFSLTTHENVVATFALESGTHVQREVSHLFPHHTQKQINILINRDNFRTLMDVVIINSTCTNMVQRTSTMLTHPAMMAI